MDSIRIQFEGQMIGGNRGLMMLLSRECWCVCVWRKCERVATLKCLGVCVCETSFKWYWTVLQIRVVV